MRQVRIGALMSVVLVAIVGCLSTIEVQASTAPPYCPPGFTCGAGGGTSLGGVGVNQSLSYDNTYANPSNTPGNPPGPATSSCNYQTGYEYYGLTVDIASGTVQSGVNSLPISQVSLVGGSPYGTKQYPPYLYNSVSGYPSSVNSATNNYVLWEGTWTPTWSWVSTSTTGWVATNPPVTSINPPANTATTKWVQDGYVDVNGVHYALYEEYLWETTTTSTYEITGCNLVMNPSPSLFGITHYCVSVSCVEPYFPPFTNLINKLNSLEQSWSASSITSTPPANSVTVGIPTTFTIQGTTLPNSGGETYTAPSVVVKLPFQRQLTMKLQIQAGPQWVKWTYTEAGGQSGYLGFACSFQTSPYSSDGGTNENCGNNAGVPSANGYIFTHDATLMTMRAEIDIAVSATATWEVSNTTYTYNIPLNSNNVYIYVPPLNKPPAYRSTVGQIEAS